MNETKEEALSVALELFSREGYTAVTIRDICKEVSIKESPTYYHFANKQEILIDAPVRFEAPRRCVPFTRSLHICSEALPASQGDRICCLLHGLST